MARSMFWIAIGPTALLLACSSQDGNPNLSGVPEATTGGAGATGTPGGSAGRSGAASTGSAGATGAAGSGSGGSPVDPVDPPLPPQGGAGGSAGKSGTGGSSAGATGSKDAGATDSAPAVPMIDCKVAKFCDDFEMYDVGGVPKGIWTVSKSKTATLAIDNTKSFSGTKSVKMTSPMAVNGAGGTGSALIRLGKPLLPLTDNIMYGRMMTFLTASPAGGVHWNSIRASGGGLSYSSGAMYQKFLANYNPHDCYKGSKLAWPVGKWSCLQWQYDGSKNAAGDGNKNEMHIWMDGAAIADETVIRFGAGCVDGTKSEWIAPQFTSLALGWENYQQSPIPIEMWIDDVAVSDKPIACPMK
jgi:hypothetical protein